MKWVLGVAEVPIFGRFTGALRTDSGEGSKNERRSGVCCGKLLHRNMSNPVESLQLGLEDLLGEMYHARRTGDLGRLALLAYYEVRRWARVAGEQTLADQASSLIHDTPHANRDEFIARIDALIDEIENVHARVLGRGQAPLGRDFVATSPGTC